MRQTQSWRLGAAVGWALGVLGSLSGPAIGQPDWIAEGRRAMVAADSEHASRIGRDVLQAGGNAVDAAVAVSFALAVARPQSTGLGGGGFLIYRQADTGQVHLFDFRESAPGAATPGMFAEASEGPSASQIGGRAVATPGVVAGCAMIRERFGSKPLAELIKPSIRLAREGFPVDAHYVDACQEVMKHYVRWPGLRSSCSYVYRTHLREGNLRSAGDSLVQPELAGLLEAIANEGPDVFYRGRVADAIAKIVGRNAGILTLDDLAHYRVIEREPLRGTYREYELILMPPPSSGGVCLAEALNILERVNIGSVHARDPNLAAHYLVEAMKHAFADRARWLGDTDFVGAPIERLISKPYAAGLPLQPQVLTSRPDVDGYGSTVLPDDAGTSHFCIVDERRNVVVGTETINTSFGSLLAVDEWGLILNNEMDDFSAVPGAPNAFGLTQSTRNAIGPNKRPLSSMSPTIVLKQGEPILALGGSGGPRIISSVLNVLVNLLDLGMGLEEAVTAVRVHHQWQPPVIYFDQAPPPGTEEELRRRGHSLSDERKIGIVQVIELKVSQLRGASDPRKGGKPASY